MLCLTQKCFWYKSAHDVRFGSVGLLDSKEVQESIHKFANSANSLQSRISSQTQPKSKWQRAQGSIEDKLTINCQLVRQGSVQVRKLSGRTRFPPVGWACMSRKHNQRNNQWLQAAFENLMIHWILQFALNIAFRYVLHRSRNQCIHRHDPSRHN